jgi:hypothetical protein
MTSAQVGDSTPTARSLAINAMNSSCHGQSAGSRTSHLAQVDVLPQQLGQAQTLAERGRQREAGVRDQALRVKTNFDDVR